MYTCTFQYSQVQDYSSTKCAANDRHRGIKHSGTEYKQSGSNEYELYEQKYNITVNIQYGNN